MRETPVQPAPATEPPALPPPVRIPGRRILPTPAERNMLVSLANDTAGCGVNGTHTAAAVFAKLLVGWEHGLLPGTSLNDIKLIDGRLTLPEMVAVAAIRNSGIGDIRTIEVAADHAIVEVTRADWAPGRKELVTHTRADAIAAGLVTFDGGGRNISKKDNWRRSEGPMHLARARGEAKRRYFEEEAAGLAYSPDELGAETDEDGRATDNVILNRAPSATQPTPTAASDFAQPAGEPTPPPAPIAFRPPPQSLPATPPPTQVVEDPLILEATRHVVALKLDKAEWQALVRRLGGTDSIRTVSGEARARILDFLRNLHRIEQLRNLAGVGDVSWQAALKRHNVTKATELSPDTARAIYDKLAEAVTPFDRARLELPDPAPGQGEPLAGKALTSSPTPAPVAA